MRGGNMTPENMARAVVEGVLCGLADGVSALRDVGVEVRRMLLTGGASESWAVRAVAASLFGVRRSRPPHPAEYVALGAAKQAAWAASGEVEPPRWQLRSEQHEAGAVDERHEVRAAYRLARRCVHGI